MQSFVKNLFSQFNRGHASFFGSSAIVQLFPLISAPIVARLYTPTDFGIYAVYYALMSILGGIASLSLFNAALLESKGEKSMQASILGIYVSAAFSAAVFLILWLLPHSWLSAALGPGVLPLLILLPLSVFLTSAFQCIYSWAVKADLFQLLARNKLILGASTVMFQIAIGFFHPSSLGLVIANLLGQFWALVLLGSYFWSQKRLTGFSFSFEEARVMLRQHKDLVIWTTPAALVNYVSSFLPDLLINKLFGAAPLGQYSLANRMINFPLTFVASSVQDIFRQQATEEFDTTGSCKQSFNRFYWLLVLASCALIVPLVLVLPYVFPIIFGAQWDQAGYLIQAIAVLVIVRFISSPLSYVWIIRGHQRLDFMWQLGLLVMVLATFLVPSALLGVKLDIYHSLWIYGLGVGIWYLFCLFVSYKFSQEGTGQPVPTHTES